MKKIFKIEGMSCNSCVNKIESALEGKVDNVKISLAREEAKVGFDSEKISEKEIRDLISATGYGVVEGEKIGRDKVPTSPPLVEEKPEKSVMDKIGFFVMIGAILALAVFLYFYIGKFNIQLPTVGESSSLILLFAAGILTGFHCIAMCGGFVVSYTTKNALRGHKSFKQHLVYGGSKVLSYTIIGGIFGLIGGVIAFSVGLRGWVAILAGIFMIFYSLGMMGIGFFKKFQFNLKFLSKIAGKEHKGMYRGPLITGLLNGLFIACGPLQAMYLYAAGSASFVDGATSLFAFGLGTLPVMLGFGGLATVISHKTTKKILKISSIIVLILGLIMINRGLTLTGSQYSLSSIKDSFSGNSNADDAVLKNGIQEVNMGVDASGYSPNSFVLKKGVPVKWNVNVLELTGCNSELILNAYNIDKKLKKGLNVIEFTPDKTGTIRFSCGMGMLRGSFIVTETGEASQQELSAATPQASGSCNMSAGGGGCGCGE